MFHHLFLGRVPLEAQPTKRMPSFFFPMEVHWAFELTNWLFKFAIRMIPTLGYERVPFVVVSRRDCGLGLQSTPLSTAEQPKQKAHQLVSNKKTQLNGKIPLLLTPQDVQVRVLHLWFLPRPKPAAGQEHAVHKPMPESHFCHTGTAHAFCVPAIRAWKSIENLPSASSYHGR